MDQVRNFLSAGYVPQPKQLQFHSLCRAADLSSGPREIAFGGARGPGKSHAMFAQITLDDCQRFPGLKALMLRKVGKAMKESIEDMRRKILGQVPHKYNRSSGEILFPHNGSRIVMGHFKDAKDIDAYVGLEYDLLGVEEATTLTASKYKLIRTCCRTSKGNWRPRVYSNANPGGVGHAWYKAKFIVGAPGTAFIPATYKDNVFLDEGYEETLNGLTGWLRQAWMEGDWDIAAGQYFSNWNPDVHVVEPWEWQSGELRFYLSMDYGWKHPTVAILLGEDNQGRVFVLAEYGAAKRLPEQHSRELMAMLGRVGVVQGEIRAMVIGADAFRTLARGKTTASVYRTLGWPFESARMDRTVGAQTILQYLGEPPEVAPKLFIFNTCPQLIRQLPEMQHDPHRVEDVMKVNVDSEGVGGDDYFDALRYGLMAIAEKPGQVTIATLPGWS